MLLLLLMMRFSCFAKSAYTKVWLQPVPGRQITRLPWLGCSAGASHNDTVGVGRFAWLFMVHAESFLYMSAGALVKDRLCRSLVNYWELSHCSWDAVLLALALEHDSLVCPFFTQVPHNRWPGRLHSGSIWSALLQRQHFP